MPSASYIATSLWSEAAACTHMKAQISLLCQNVINFAAYMKSEDGYTFGDNLGTDPHGWHAVGDIGHSAAGLSYSLILPVYYLGLS